MNFTKYNKKSVEWNVKTDGFSFKKISELVSKGVEKVQVFGFFFVKSESYGLQPIAILKDCLLNLPIHRLNDIKEILADSEAVEAVKNGECSLKFKHYHSKYNRECFDFDFCNTEETPIF